MTSDPVRAPAAPGSVSVHLLQSGGVVEAGGPSLFPQLARLTVDAYPVIGVNNAEGLTRYLARLTDQAGDDGTSWAVALRDGELVGAMRLYDFVMNLRGTDTPAGGVGSVAVALAAKRQGVARTMIAWFAQTYRSRGASFALLHPFRPDFYRALGFGYGSPQHRFRFAPETLRSDGAAGTVRTLGSGDADAVVASSERVRAQTNGMVRKHHPPLVRALDDTSLRWIGVDDGDGVLRAFMQTSVVLGPDGTANANELLVRDLTAESDAHAAALLAYLSAQRDQFARVIIETHDEALYLSSRDPRSGHAVIASPATHRIAETGLGLMYRVLDVGRAFEHLGTADRRFALRLEVTDGAAFGLDDETYVFGPHGPPVADRSAAGDAVLRIGAADLSSLIAGSLALRDLVRHRLAQLLPAGALDIVARLLDTPQRPVCTTRF